MAQGDSVLEEWTGIFNYPQLPPSCERDSNLPITAGPYLRAHRAVFSVRGGKEVLRSLRRKEGRSADRAHQVLRIDVDDGYRLPPGGANASSGSIRSLM